MLCISKVVFLSIGMYLYDYGTDFQLFGFFWSAYEGIQGNKSSQCQSRLYNKSVSYTMKVKSIMFYIEKVTNATDDRSYNTSEMLNIIDYMLTNV